MSEFHPEGMPVLGSLNLPACALESIDLTHNPALSIVDLRNNRLTRLTMNPPSYYSVMTQLQVSNNRLTFDYLEPHMNQVYRFIYADQLPIIGRAEAVEAVIGNSVVFTVETGGQKNLYQWQKRNTDGTTWLPVPGGTSNVLLNNSVTTADAGVYRCAITNESVTGLTLLRQEITLTVRAGLNASGLAVRGETEGNAGLALYPIPADDQLTIRVGDIGAGVRVDLVNSSGVVLRKLEAPSETVSIDTRDLATGIYFVKIQGIGALTVRKVAIVH